MFCTRVANLPGLKEYLENSNSKDNQYEFNGPTAKINGSIPWKRPPPSKERTYIMIKPDGVQRGMVGPIIKGFEKKGFKMVGMKMCQPGKEMFEKHYADLSSKKFFPGLVEYAASGPVCCMVW